MQTLHMGKSTSVLLLGLLFVWCVVVAVCCIFVMNVNKVTSKEVDRYLFEITSGISSTVGSHIEEMFRTLNSIGGSYFQYADHNADMAMKFLQEKASLYGFERLSVTEPSGHTIWSDGRSLDISALPYVAEGFKGKMSFLRLRQSPLDGSDDIVYSRPVQRQGKIVGVITAWSDVRHVQQYLHAPVFNGKGHFHILDADGNVLLSPPEEDAAVSNYFDLLAKRADMQQAYIEIMHARMLRGESGRLNFILDGTHERTAVYVPLQDDGLYVLTAVPSGVAWSQFDNLLRQTLLLTFVIMIFFTSLAIFLFVKNRNFTRKLEVVAYVDPVTGGMTRNCFQLEALPKIEAAPPGTYSLVSVNIKQFKLINDMLGNETGDKLLKQFHDCMKDHMSQDELICRDYADDFVLLVTTKSREMVLTIVASITAQINMFFAELSSSYKLRLSFGVYEIEDKTLSLVSLLDRANIARKNSKAIYGHLYECVFYNDLERLRMIKTKDIENKMDKALKNGDFIVYLQPKIELKNKIIVGAEALTRWRDKDTGLIPPGDFIPCFETNGFIIKLDLYIFERICRVMRKWIDYGLNPVSVSVNLSRLHLLDPNFLQRYVAIRDKYAIPHGLLEIELTESLVFENAERLVNVVNDLHANGFKCSLDDFGCGYSSLNLLRDINVDTLKLDGAFWVSPNADNQREKDIIATVVDLARKLGMTTVSEGVETVSQLEFLRQIRCDMV